MNGCGYGSETLWRLILFVPGAEPCHLEKAQASGADVLLFDLEDAVEPTEKGRARGLVTACLRARSFGRSIPAVRVNAVSTALFLEDIAAVVSAGGGAILLPKVEFAEDLAWASRQLDELEQFHHRDTSCCPTQILALVETAKGILLAPALANGSLRVAALCFGHVDFSTDMGIEVGDPREGVVQHARCAVAIAARASCVACRDTVCVDIRDDSTFRQVAFDGLRLGYDGKLCIHPRQVALENEVYTPTRAAVDYARRATEAYAKAEREGRGVISLDGKMVDAPMVSAQRRVLEKARKAGIFVESPLGVPADG